MPDLRPGGGPHMSRYLIALVATAALCTVAGPAFAHHGTAAFDLAKVVTVKGTVTSFDFAGTLQEQARRAQGPAAGSGLPAAAKPSPPGPLRDWSGVWMMGNPPGSNRGYTNFTFTDPKTDPPAMTAWGLEKFKEAKDSN